jgi:hypothetical protein
LEQAFGMSKGRAYVAKEESNHGRIENRRCGILPAKDFLSEEHMRAWKNVSTLIKIETSREIKGVPHRETRYYIRDETIYGPSYYLSLARGHWGIEKDCTGIRM